jgi:hypothetical protein
VPTVVIVRDCVVVVVVDDAVDVGAGAEAMRGEVAQPASVPSAVHAANEAELR